MTHPDFIIAGFNRCGTSTLHALLDQHPQICMSRPKEVHYFNFDTKYRQGPQIYDQAFEHCDPGSLRGEATPSYMYHGHLFEDGPDSFTYNDKADSIQRIALDAPATKLIISLRHPVDAALSHFNKAYLQGRVHPQETLISALEEEWAGRRRITDTDLCYFYLTSYSRHIRHLLKHIPREQVLILIFEEWTHDQQAALEQFSCFLGLEPHRMVSDEPVIKNTGRTALIPGLQAGLKKIMPQRLAMAAYRRLGSRPGYKSLSPAEYHYAASAYTQEIRELEALLDRDLSLWAIAESL